MCRAAWRRRNASILSEIVKEPLRSGRFCVDSSPRNDELNARFLHELRDRVRFRSHAKAQGTREQFLNRRGYFAMPIFGSSHGY